MNAAKEKETLWANHHRSLGVQMATIYSQEKLDSMKVNKKHYICIDQAISSTIYMSLSTMKSIHAFRTCCVFNAASTSYHDVIFYLSTTYLGATVEIKISIKIIIFSHNMQQPSGYTAVKIPTCRYWRLIVSQWWFHLNKEWSAGYILATLSYICITILYEPFSGCFS